jgi:hypothetical protein
MTLQSVGEDETLCLGLVGIEVSDLITSCHFERRESRVHSFNRPAELKKERESVYCIRTWIDEIDMPKTNAAHRLLPFATSHRYLTLRLARINSSSERPFRTYLHVFYLLC